LEFAHYDFVRLHKSLRIIPAKAADVSDRLWSLEELVEQTSRWGVMSRPIRLPETLSDGVVLLDGHTLSDAQQHLEGEDEEMIRRFEAPRHATLDEMLTTIQRWMEARAVGVPNFCYAIRMPDGLLVGGCEVRWLAAPSNALNISYWCYPRFRGRGFVGRAVTLVLGAVLTTGATQIEAHIDVDNVASRKVAERARFVEEGTVVDDAASGEGAVTRLRFVRALRN
jgi:RimJ/RimL family protein N-acetyltransferase